MKKNELQLLIREEIERLIKEQRADDIKSITIDTVGLTNRIYKIIVYNKNGTYKKYYDIKSFNKSFGTNIPIDGIRNRDRIQQDFKDALPNVEIVLGEFDVT
jgi:hypothetical protein